MNTFSLNFRKYVTGALIATLFSSVSAQINNLVKTPPMGWNSWNVFHENINETQIKAIADVMVSSGMRDAGTSTSILTITGWQRPVMRMAICGLIQPDFPVA
jgi:hypothetical protein